MKIILDADAYRRNNYGRSVGFQSLLDYAKKTDSQIVLLASVQKEVVALYGRELSEEISHAETAARNLQKKVFRKQQLAVLPVVEIEAEVDELEAALRRAASGVTIEFFEDYSSLDVLDVVQRGARRIPPANSNGEQLRDVINWYATLECARRSGVKVLFVSADSGFWDGKGEQKQLKRQISEDIGSAGVEIDLYNQVDDLLKKNSLSSQPLDRERADSIFHVSDFAGVISEKLRDAVARTKAGKYLFLSPPAEVISATFQRGVSYQISRDHEYLESTYEIDTRVAGEPRLADSPEVPWEMFASESSGDPSMTVSSSVASQPIRVNFKIIVEADFSARVIQGSSTLAGVESVRPVRIESDTA